MADLSITAANVAVTGGSESVAGTAGAAITAGQVLYRDASDGTYKLADADSATVAARSPAGIALNSAAAGQPVRVHIRGPVTIGATIAGGTAYFLSATAGGICPAADLAAGDYPTIVGIARSASVLDVRFHESGFELA